MDATTPVVDPTDLVSVNLYPFTVVNACQQTGNTLVALKTQPKVIIRQQAQGRKRQFDVHSVIGPFTSFA